MTEADWMNGLDVEPRLRSLRGKISDRKLRLWNLACCEQVLPVLAAKPYGQYPVFKAAREFVAVLEHCAEEAATHDDELELRLNEWMVHWDDADRWALEDMQRGTYREEGLFSHWPTAQAEALTAIWIAANASYGGVSFLYDAAFAVSDHVGTALRGDGSLSLMFCDLVGNPFRPVDVDWTRLNGSVRRVAETIYAERNFADLPILADALEEAGCQSPEVAFHLRAYDVHVRGCWVLDLLLGKK